MTNKENQVVKVEEPAGELALSAQSGLKADEAINLTHLTMNQLNFIGKAMAASGAFKDIKSQSAALVRILAGQEMGMGPFAAMANINIIDGNASVGGHIMAARVKGSKKYDYKVTKWDRDECSIDFYEDGKKIGTSDFSMQDAKDANLASKFNWKAYPRNMLFNRAISNGVRTYCPDVLGSAPVYDPDELGAVTDDVGRVTQLPATAVPAIAPSVPEGPAVPFDQPADNDETNDVDNDAAAGDDTDNGDSVTSSENNETTVTSETPAEDEIPDEPLTDQQLVESGIFPPQEDKPAEKPQVSPEVWEGKPTARQMRDLTALFTKKGWAKGDDKRVQYAVVMIEKDKPETYGDYQNLIDSFKGNV